MNISSADFWIDHLNIRLPQGLEKRAGGIARNLGEQLARLPFSTVENLEIASLAISGITVSGGETDAVIAGRIALAIHQQIYQHLHQQLPATTLRADRSPGD